MSQLREEFFKAYQVKTGKSEGTAGSGAPANVELKETLRLAVLNQKGGCGKTTTSINLSAALAEMGYRVLLVDLDPQAHATLGLGIVGDDLECGTYHLLLREGLSALSVMQPTFHKNFKILPANGLLASAQMELLSVPHRDRLLKGRLEELKDLFDFVIMDCPPSLNILTINALTAATRLIVPVQTQYYSLDGMRELFKTIALVRENANPDLQILGILPTLFDGRTKMNRAMLEALRGYFREQLFESVIRLNAALAECPMMGQPVTRYAPASRGTSDYKQLAEEVLVRASRTGRSIEHSQETV